MVFCSHLESPKGREEKSKVLLDDVNNFQRKHEKQLGELVFSPPINSKDFPLLPYNKQTEKEKDGNRDTPISNLMWGLAFAVPICLAFQKGYEVLSSKKFTN